MRLRAAGGPQGGVRRRPHPEIKQQIIGGNIARLYGIDVPAKLEAIKDDEFARRRSELLGQPAGGG